MATRFPFHTPDYQGGNVDTWGKPWFVKSTHVQARNSTSHGTSKDIPFASLAYALTDARVVAGDVIHLAHDHRETVSSATALLFNKAGLTIQGHGHGLQRSRITLDTATTATVPVSAAGIILKNVTVLANFADIVSAFTVTANDFRVENCLVGAVATDMNFLHVIDTNTTDGSANGLTVLNSQWYEPDAATLAFMLLDSAISRLRIEGNHMVTGAATQDVAFLITGATGKDIANLYVKSNDMYMTGNSGSTAGLLITTDGTAGTGTIAYNNLYHLDATSEILITATHHFSMFENRATAVFNASGYVRPAVDS
jgi:hypothetical protein